MVTHVLESLGEVVGYLLVFPAALWSLYGALPIAAVVILGTVPGARLDLTVWDAGLILGPPLVWGFSTRGTLKEIPSLFGEPPIVGSIVAILLAWRALSPGWLRFTVPAWTTLALAILAAVAIGRFFDGFREAPPEPGAPIDPLGCCEDDGSRPDSLWLVIPLFLVPVWAMYAGPAIAGSALVSWLAAVRIEIRPWDFGLAIIPPLEWFGLSFLWMSRIPPGKPSTTFLGAPVLLGCIAATLVGGRAIAEAQAAIWIPGYVAFAAALVAAVVLAKWCPDFPE